LNLHVALLGVSRLSESFAFVRNLFNPERRVAAGGVGLSSIESFFLLVSLSAMRFLRFFEGFLALSLNSSLRCSFFRSFFFSYFF